jgi:hypothetical protein
MAVETPLPRFDVEDKFNKDKAFTRIRYGRDASLLDVELNEMQKILQSRDEQMTSITLTNGFLNKPAMTLSSGTLTVPVDTVIFQGKIIEILQNMTLSGLVNNDVIYLAMWEEVVDFDDTIRRGGNYSGGTTISNSDIIDSELGIESSRRVQLKVQLSKTNLDSSKQYLRIASLSSVGALTDERNRVSLGNILVSPANIVTDANNRFMTDAEKTKLSGISASAKKVEASVTNGNIKIDGTETNVYTHPSTHSLDIITETTAKKIMTDTERTKLAGISTGATKTTNPATNGVIQIDGVNQTVYAHPTGDGNMHVPATGTTNTGKILSAGATAGSLSWVERTLANLVDTTISAPVQSNLLMFDGGVWKNVTLATAGIAPSSHVGATGSAHGVATTAVNGFMSTTDKSKLDGIASGAEVNQSAFSNFLVGSTTISADNKQDTIEIVAGIGISLVADAVNDKITINSTAEPNGFTNFTAGATTVSADQANDTLAFTAGAGLSITGDATNDAITFAVALTDTAHGNRGGGALHAVATTGANGFMSSADKQKLDNMLMTQTATLPATAGWYRVATSAVGVGRLFGHFAIDWTLGGMHGVVKLEASHFYGATVSTELNQLQYANYSGEGVNGLTKARIVYHTTYTGNYAYLEVYNVGANAITVNVELLDSSGWSLVTPSTAGSIPAGYSNSEITFKDGIVSNGGIYASKGQINGVDIETTTGAGTKASTAETNAINFAKSFGLGTDTVTFPGTDLNNHTVKTGFYQASNYTNKPNSSSWHYVIHVRHNNAQGYVTQIVIPFDVNDVYVRNCYAGVWSEWKRQLTTADAIDADTLDGVALDGLLQLSGGTLTGLLTTLGITVNGVLNANTANGRMIAPVGVDKWA